MSQHRITIRTCLAAWVLVGLSGLAASSAHAQGTTRVVPPAAQPVRNVQPVPAAPVATTAPATAPQPVQTQVVARPAGDPYGFIHWLNATRARYGLPAVGYDPNLANWAAVNNNQQQARGMGHYVMGPARRQNCAVGNAANIGAMWMNSPGHRAALLDPTIRWIGLAGMGAYWTFNAY